MASSQIACQLKPDCVSKENVIFFKRFIFREKEGEKHQCVVASQMPLTGGLAHNPGLCPDWEWSWRPFGSQASARSTEPQQPK